MKSLILFAVVTLLGCNYGIAQAPQNSLDFDGSNDYVTCALPNVFNNTASNDFTIEAWIKPAASNFCRVVFAQSSGSNFASLSLSNTNQVYFYVSNSASQSTTNTLPLGVWSHVACTWDASASQIIVYINGIAQTSSNGGSSSVGNNGIMTIGARTNAAQFFNGELDEVRIWDVERQPCEIMQSMNAEITVGHPNLVASYNFNEGVAGGTNTGVTGLPDLTSNHNGTLLNFGLAGSSSNWLTSGVIFTGTNPLISVDTVAECGQYTWIDGNTYSASTNAASFAIAGGGTNGCDSIVLLDLTILNAAAGTDVVNACGTSSYTWIDGNTYSSSNNTATYTYVAGASNGCDSVVTLDLTIGTPNTGTDVINECGPYTWIDGNTYTSSTNIPTWTLTNVSGCDSVVTLDLTIGTPNTGTDVINECGPYTWIDGNTYTTSTNTPTWTLTNTSGCDSVVTLDLTINSISDITTTATGISITANNANASYQWLDCDNNFAILPGETSQSFTATMNGNYAVELTENGCVDTSACESISTVGIVESSFGAELIVYPNPTDGKFTIDLGHSYSETIAEITDLVGRQVISTSSKGDAVMQFTLENEPSGIYMLSITSEGRRAFVQIVKQ